MKRPISIIDYLSGNQTENILSQIFPGAIPETKIWTDPIEIYEVLQAIAGCSPPHSAFLPGGGHIHLHDVNMPLQDHIDLIDAFPYRFKVNKFSFSKLSDKDYYFHLDSYPSNPTGLGFVFGKPAAFETVAESEPGKYINRDFHDYYGSYEHNYGVYQEMYSIRPHLVKLCLKGSVLIVNNSNPYNFAPFASSDYHSQMTPAELKSFMQLFSDELSNS